jgi:hypothetical protein
MKTILALALALAAPAIAGEAVGPPAAPTTSTSAAQWHEDLAFLRQKLLAMHPDPFRRESRAAFDGEAERLDASFVTLSREQAITGLMRLVAGLHDGHTTVLPGPQTRAGFHVLPLRFYLYGDQLVLDGADRAYAQGLGGALTAIDGVPAADVLNRVRAVVSGDNESSVATRLPSYVVVPEILAGVGVIRPDEAKVQVALTVGGKPVVLQVDAIPAPPSREPASITTRYTADWVDRAPEAAPLWLRHADQPYWSTFEPKTGLLYLQYNKCESDPAEAMPRFARRLEQALASQRVRRVVVDLRLNMGGEGYWNRFLLRALFRSPLADRKDGLFVLVGRQTFSAGNMMAIELEKYTEATFVGEPSGGSIQGFGNHEPVFLPNSGLGVMIATKFYQNDGPNDDRPAIAPTIAALLTARDYAEGRDPALAAALASSGSSSRARPSPARR